MNDLKSVTPIMKTNDTLDFLPAALEIQERPPSPAGRAILWSIMVFFLLALTWACIGEVDIVATAHGKIIPNGQVKIIQPLELGVVRHIPVTEGQRVAAGEILIELDPTATEADVERLQQQITEAQGDLQRYDRLLARQEAEAEPAATIQRDTQPVSRNHNEEAPWQNHMLNAEWGEYQARLAALDHRIASQQAEQAVNEAQIKKLQATLPLITQRVKSLHTLVEKQLYAQQSGLELEEQRLAQQQDLLALRNGSKRIDAAMAEIREQRAAAVQEFRRTLLGKRAEAERNLKALQQETIKAEQRTRLQALRAPIAGRVQQLAIHTVGGIVTPAQELMKIVPEHQQLEVEAWVQNKDIGFVDEQQQAVIKVEAFPFTKYGAIDGKVLTLSSDAVPNENTGLVYAARVLMEKARIEVNNKEVSLTPGMSVTVEMKTGTRKLIEYILSPLLRAKDEGLRER